MGFVIEDTRKKPARSVKPVKSVAFFISPFDFAQGVLKTIIRKCQRSGNESNSLVASHG